MGYGLGVDLGTTFTTAAVNRDGRREMATLGDHAAAVPSVVLVRPDGSTLTGDAADRRAVAEPDRVAREAKRRLGDPMPLLLGDTPVPPQELMATQLRHVVGVVAEREGAAPDVVTLTHPANWGPHKRQVFDEIPRRAGLHNYRMITEPEAAAAHYAENERLGDGEVIAVYDLGGGTFDATVLRTDQDGFAILGRPEGVEGLGGVDFDDAVFAHIDRCVDGAVSRLDPSDPSATSAVVRLRHECVLAKEALSADTETTIPVLLPGVQTEVRLTRHEFESMIEPAISTTIASLSRALRSAGVAPAALSAVLLVGGSSRIPVVSRMVSSALGRPTAVDTHPKHAVVLGAAVTADDVVLGQPPQTDQNGHCGEAGAAAAGLEAGTVAMRPVAASEPAPAGAPLPAQPLAAAGTPAAGIPAPSLTAAPSTGRRKGRALVAAGVLAVLLLGGGAFAYATASSGSSGVPPASVPALPPPVPAAASTPDPTTANAPQPAGNDAPVRPAPQHSSGSGSGGGGGGGGGGHPTTSTPTTTQPKSGTTGGTTGTGGTGTGGTGTGGTGTGGTGTTGGGTGGGG